MPSLRSLRRSLAVVALTALVGCSTCSTKCSTGLSLVVRSLMGSLAAGSAVEVQFCFDHDCKLVRVSRKLTPSGRVFLPFSGVGSSSDHTIDLTGPGGMQGHYTGPLQAIQERKGCATCKVATVNIADSGAIEPGVVVTTSTTAPATTAKGG